MNDRERLVRMVGGRTGRKINSIIVRFGKPGREEYDFSEEEVGDFLREGDDTLFLFEARSDERERTLRESKCLVRQADGGFVCRNVGQAGPIYLVD